MVGGVCLGLCLPVGTAERWGIILLAASLLFCGMPHGASDLWAMRLATPHQVWTSRARWRLIAAYLSASLLTLAVWWWQPTWALAGFLALTAWHFGSADALLLTGGRAGSFSWWTQAAARGVLVMSAPLAFYPEESARLLEPFALQDAGTQLDLIRFLLVRAPTFTAAAIAVQTLLVLPRIFADQTGRLTDTRRRAVAALGETCLIAVLFWCAAPLLAFACYWIGGHAWRHILRIETLQWQDASPAHVPTAWRMVLDYHERTLGLTLLALAGLAVVFLIWPTLATGANGWVTAYFLLLSALTVPHALVIGYLDWKTRTPLISTSVS